MHYTTLGRTGFRVSKMGLGCGGHSRLGLSRGATEEQAERVVREAIDLGITFIDTAEGYGTEEVVGRGIAGTSRERLVLSTKVGATWHEKRCAPADLRGRLEGSLKRLQTDYLDVYHLHGVQRGDYAYAFDELVPVLQELKREGKIRAIGITEAFAPDPTHKMLAPAVHDDVWDVIMVGFNLLNPSARDRVLAVTKPKEVGTLCMFAVRRALSRPDALRELLDDMIREGLINAGDVDPERELRFLTAPGVANSLQEAAYRFCLWEPGIDVVLSGTGDVGHLRENARSLSSSPLPEEITTRLARIFRNVDSVSGN